MRDTPGIIPGKRFFLVDCNNFFVSCEQVFNPRLIGKPVVVLSNNDGCVVSRSQEAKALGIAMGEAVFKIEPLIKRHNVQVLSSNFSLYADMSARVMQTLAGLSADMEIYSIDEAFLFAPYTKDYDAYGRHMRALVRKHTGIPVSIGIAPTKTLAKVANKFVKRRPELQGVFDITEHPQIDQLLASLPVQEVWGVGYRYGRMLVQNRITTIKDLKYAPDAWVRKHMTILGLKTVLELRGIPCLNLIDHVPAKQSITVSRSFGKLVSERRSLEEAIASHTIRAAQKLRREKEVAALITVYITTSRYHDHDQYYNAASYNFLTPTDYTPYLLDGASACLDEIFKQGYLYKKVGIMLSHLVAAEHRQLDLFNTYPDLSKQAELMRTYDRILSKFGSHSLSYVSAGVNPLWKAKRLRKSPHYTTNWHEILTVT